MKMRRADVFAFLASPGAWVLLAASIVSLGWLTGDPVLRWGLAVVFGAALFASVSWLDFHRRRSPDLLERVRRSSEQEERVQQFLNQIPSIVWAENAAVGITFITDAWTGVTGRPLADALERKWLDLVHPDDRQEYVDVHRQALSRRESATIEFRLKNSQGSWIWMHEHMTPHFDQHGEFRGLIGAAIDITVRKQREDELQPQLDDLQLERDALANDIERTAADRDREKSERRRIAKSHEWTREYLSALTSDLELCLRELNGAAGVLRTAKSAELPSSAGEKLGRANDHLALLIERTQARLGSDDAVIEAKEDCNLRDIIDRAVGRSTRESDASAEAVATEIGDDVPAMIQSDPAQFTSMLTELVRCAGQFAGDQPTTLSIERISRAGMRSQIAFSVSLSPDRAPPAALAHPYYPAEEIGGVFAGLGLGKCRRAAEALHGSIAVELDDDQQPRITITLDVDEVSSGADGRRSHGRLRQESVHCAFGEVLDLSMGGMRIRATKELEGDHTIELRDQEESITVTAVVAWCKHGGIRKYEVGFRFLELDADTKARLSRFATRNRTRRIMDAA